MKGGEKYMQWKDIHGYEGYYEVSTMGDVRSKDRIVPDKNSAGKHLKGRIMKQSENKDSKRGGQGYLVVNLRKNHTSNVIQVHRLVASAFIENPLNLPTVNHKDGDKHNNCVENLEWATYGDNNIHALKSDLRSPRGCEVARFDECGNIIDKFKSVSEASRETGISRGMISHCVNGRAYKAGGYVWKKIEKCNDYPNNGSTVEDELPLEVLERKLFTKI